MKAIQITVDEKLLRGVDRDPEVKKHGRSALIRRLLQEHLRRRREKEIDDAYERGYSKHPPTQDELGPWPDVQAWPELFTDRVGTFDDDFAGRTFRGRGRGRLLGTTGQNETYGQQGESGQP